MGMARTNRTASSASRVVGYVRVSSLEQATEGVSLQAQETAVRAYCTMRGLELADLISDPAVSAGKPLSSRPGGARVLEMVKRGEVGAVVALKLDRLFRNAADCLEVTAAWDRCGAALHLVDLGGQAIDTSSAMGRFFLCVMAGAAEMERGLIRERTRMGMDHKRSKGERLGQVPYGYRPAADGVALEPEPDEQQVIGMIKSLRAGGLTLQAITDRLNADQVPARGQRWHATTIGRVIKRAA